MRIESTRKIKNSAENIYNYISNFTNFAHLLPEQVENWKCTETSCSFQVKGFFHLGLEIKEKNPFTSIIIGEEPETKSPFPFMMIWEFNQENEQLTNVKLNLEVELNAMVAMMAKKPLQNLANVLTEKLDEILG